MLFEKAIHITTLQMMGNGLTVLEQALKIHTSVRFHNAFQSYQVLLLI